MARFEQGDRVVVMSKTVGTPLEKCDSIFLGAILTVVRRTLVSVPEFYCEVTEQYRSKKYLYGCQGQWSGTEYSFYFEDLQPYDKYYKEGSMEKEYKKVPKRRLTILAFKRMGACDESLAELMKNLILRDNDYISSTKAIPLELLLELTSKSEQEWLEEQGVLYNSIVQKYKVGDRVRMDGFSEETEWMIVKDESSPASIYLVSVNPEGEFFGTLYGDAESVVVENPREITQKEMDELDNDITLIK